MSQNNQLECNPYRHGFEIYFDGKTMRCIMCDKGG